MDDEAVYDEDVAYEDVKPEGIDAVDEEVDDENFVEDVDHMDDVDAEMRCKMYGR